MYKSVSHMLTFGSYQLRNRNRMRCNSLKLNTLPLLHFPNLILFIHCQFSLIISHLSVLPIWACPDINPNGASL